MTNTFNNFIKETYKPSSDTIRPFTNIYDDYCRWMDNNFCTNLYIDRSDFYNMLRGLDGYGYFNYGGVHHLGCYKYNFIPIVNINIYFNENCIHYNERNIYMLNEITKFTGGLENKCDTIFKITSNYASKNDCGNIKMINSNNINDDINNVNDDSNDDNNDNDSNDNDNIYEFDDGDDDLMIYYQNNKDNNYIYCYCEEKDKYVLILKINRKCKNILYYIHENNIYEFVFYNHESTDHEYYRKDKNNIFYKIYSYNIRFGDAKMFCKYHNIKNHSDVKYRYIATTKIKNRIHNTGL
jgi:hypothetical protein